MKILILLSRWAGGVGTVVKGIKKELEKKGHQVDIISRKEDLGFDTLLPSLLPLRKFLVKKMKEEEYDIIYTQDWSLVLPFLIPYPIFGRKQYCCFHGNQPTVTRAFQNLVGNYLGDHLIVVGDSLKERFPNSMLVHNGVDREKFKPLKKKREYLGWLDKITETISSEEIIKLSSQLNLKPLIAKDIPFEEMNNFYNKCKGFISLPPESAGFNLCWVEAMSAGVPIIIGNERGIGWKLPITKVKDIKEIKKGIKGKDYIKWLDKNNLSWKENAEKLLEIWKEND